MACVVCLPSQCSENCVLRCVFSGVGTKEEVELSNYRSRNILARLEESHVRYELGKLNSQEDKIALVDSWVLESDAYKRHPIFGPNQILMELKATETLVKTKLNQYKRDPFSSCMLELGSDPLFGENELDFTWDIVNSALGDLSVEGSASVWNSASGAGGSHSRSSSVSSVDESLALRASKEGPENHLKWKERHGLSADSSGGGSGGDGANSSGGGGGDGRHGFPSSFGKKEKRKRFTAERSTKEQFIENTAATANTLKNLTIKVTHEDSTVRFRFMISDGLVKLKEQIATRFQFGLGSFRLKYKDTDGDMILIACDSDLIGLVDETRQPGNQTVIRLFVVPVVHQSPDG